MYVTFVKAGDKWELKRMWMNWNRAKSAFIIVMSFASLSGVAVPTGHEPGKSDSLNRSTNDWSGYKTAIDKLKAWAGKVEGDVNETSLVDSTVTVRRSKDDLNKMAAGVEKILELRKHFASKPCENDAIAIAIGEMLDHCIGKALVRAMNSEDQSFSFSYPEWSACRTGIPEVLKAMQDKVPDENRKEFAAAWAAKLEMENISRIVWGDSVSASGSSTEGSEDEQKWKKTVEDAKSKALAAIEAKKWKEFCKWNASDTTTTPNAETAGGTSEYKPKGDTVPTRDDNGGGGKPKQVTTTEQGGYGGSQYFPGQGGAYGAGTGYQAPPNNYDPLKGLAGLYPPQQTPYVAPVAPPVSGDAGSASAPPPPPPPPPAPFPPGGVGVGVQIPPKYPPPPPPLVPPPPLYGPLPPPPPPPVAELPPPPDLFKFKVNITASPSPSPTPYGSNSMAMMNPVMMCMQLPPQVRMMNPLCMQMQQPSCPNPSICGGAYPQPLPGAIPGITTVASIQPLPTTPPVTGYPTYPTTVPGGYPSTSLTSLGQNPYATPSLGTSSLYPTTPTYGTGTMGTTYPSLTPFGQPATQPLPTV